MPNTVLRMQLRFFAVVFFLLLMSGLLAQSGYRQGQAVQNIAITKIINGNAASLNEIRKPITIIDFFGTWCVPCIKALPHLTTLQQQFPDLRIVLVSVENEEKLKKFVAARTNFTLPLVVDEAESFTAAFAPPAYPYSVVLNSKGEVLLATADVQQITETVVQKWLAENKTTTGALQPAATMATKKETVQYSSNNLVKASQQLVYAAKTGEATANLQQNVAAIIEKELQKTLVTDNDKKAFWINVYNAYTQILLRQNPELYKSRNKFFNAAQIKVAGHTYSLDDIEHAVLRRGRTKWSWGYITNPFLAKRFKKLRVQQVDYRIHFALNCGAKSCPPIAYYKPESLDSQLELATKNYLSSEAEYNASNNTLYLPAICSWFRADFGGKKGLKSLASRQGIIDNNSKPKIKFKPYNWDLYLNNYKIETEP